MSLLAAPKVKAGFEATTGVWLSEEDIDMADCCLLKVKGFGVSDGTVGVAPKENVGFCSSTFGFSAVTPKLKLGLLSSLAFTGAPKENLGPST